MTMRVLILEDDPLIAFDLEDIVLCMTSEVVVASSMAEAARQAGRGYDFALLDIDVRDGKSFPLAQALRERRIPFAFVSASMPRDLPGSLRDVPFIAKPYRTHHIAEAMHEGLGQAAA